MRFTWVLVLCLAMATTMVGENQLLNLGKEGIPRPVPSEISWPSESNQAEICLWKDDKIAACSITIDDNCAPDHPFWIELSEKLNIRLTWFVIADNVGTSFGGTWEGWRKILEAGHDVQSHGFNGGRPKDGTSPEEYREEYAASVKELEGNLPDHRVVAIAYPWGRGNADVAKEFFLACRGTSGTPNQASKIDYGFTAKGGIGQDYINALVGGPITKVKWLNKPAYRRGWIAPLYHYVAVGKTPEEKQKSRDRVAEDVTNLASYRDRIWIDTFVDVAKYGQERDTATLKTVTADKNRIELSLTDRMRDDLFNYPLTIKVRLPDDWASVQAKQKDAPCSADVVMHEGHPFALVQAIPDHGPVILTK